MALRTYLIGIFIGTILCWAAWGLTISNIDPTDAGILGLASFFSSLFFALAGTFGLIGFYIRVWLSGNEIIYENIGLSFRQGVLISLCIIGILALQGIRMLTWWNGILLVLIIIMLEFYFMAKR
jgi:hypothetical protein